MLGRRFFFFYKVGQLSLALYLLFAGDVQKQVLIFVFDAFGNKIEEKQAAKKIPKSELKKIKKRVADLRKKGQEVYTDEEVEKEGYTME